MYIPLWVQLYKVHCICYEFLGLSEITVDLQRDLCTVFAIVYTYITCFNVQLYYTFTIILPVELLYTGYRIH